MATGARLPRHPDRRARGARAAASLPRRYDLDATLHIPYSVGHVLVGTSSMADKEAHNNHMQMAALIGNLNIVVREVRHDWKQEGGQL